MTASTSRISVPHLLAHPRKHSTCYSRNTGVYDISHYLASNRNCHTYDERHRRGVSRYTSMGIRTSSVFETRVSDNFRVRLYKGYY